MSDEKSVAIRELKIYQTDDARRIEVWEKTSEATHNPLSPEVDENEDTTSFINQDKIFVGLLQIRLPEEIGPMGGPQEIRFKIDKVTTVEEAFGRYNDLAKQAADDVERQIKEMIQQQQCQQQQIITAPAEALNQIGPSHLGSEF